jgi:hypothetical protein
MSYNSYWINYVGTWVAYIQLMEITQPFLLMMSPRTFAFDAIFFIQMQIVPSPTFILIKN